MTVPGETCGYHVAYCSLFPRGFYPWTPVENLLNSYLLHFDQTRTGSDLLDEQLGHAHPQLLPYISRQHYSASNHCPPHAFW